MLARTAVILTLGMTLEKVDISPFVGFLMREALKVDQQFKLNEELQDQAMELAEKFNVGEMKSPDDFKEKLLKIFKLEKCDGFWDEWKKIVKVGEIQDKVQLMRKKAEQQGLFYLLADTNDPHVATIKAASAEKKVELQVQKDSATLDQFPLFLSCQLKKSRVELIKLITQEIQGKQTNKPKEIVLLFGRPKNHANARTRKKAEDEMAAIEQWCAQNSIKLVLHENNLQASLDKLFPEMEKQNTLVVACAP